MRGEGEKERKLNLWGTGNFKGLTDCGCYVVYIPNMVSYYICVVAVNQCSQSPSSIHVLYPMEKLSDSDFQ